MKKCKHKWILIEVCYYTNFRERNNWKPKWLGPTTYIEKDETKYWIEYSFYCQNCAEVKIVKKELKTVPNFK
jgi:hypothetical protein